MGQNLLKENLKIIDKLKNKIPQEISGLFHKHYDTIIADDSLYDIDVFLISLYLTEEINQMAGAKQNDCKVIFVFLGRNEDSFRKVLHYAKIKALVRETNGILYFLSGGLKKLNNITGQIGKFPVYIIKSGKNFTAIKLFEEFLDTQIMNDDLLLCDSYISHSTLFPFSKLKGRIKSLKILTSNICDPDKFKNYKKKMSKEFNIPIEVKINKKVHDRFIISGKKCWAIGSSIKDLGNKDAVIREISEVVKSMKELFWERWNE